MSKKLRVISFVILTAIFAINASTLFGQPILLNEVEIDPPSTISDACQYAEVSGTPGSTVPANTYFLSVNSDAGNFGFANQAINLGGQVVGSNGTITLINTFSGGCPNRSFPTGTTVLSFNSPLFIGGGGFSTQGSETYLVVRSTVALSSGQDLDSDDDGIFNANLGITVLDGFALLINPEEEYVYGSAGGVVNISNTTSTDQPDAVTRFRGNTAPFSAAAFYFGELAASPDETLAYVDPRSPNFPSGGRLSPGEPNLPTPVNDATVDFNGDGRSDFAVVRPAGGAGSQLTWFTQFNGGSPFSAREWGISGDVVISGDFDGDQRDDQAVYRESNSTFYIIESANLTIRIEQFGQAGDNPRVVADYDGDGRDDLALYRPGTQSNWYYKTSQSSLFVSVSWGITGDTPSPGDYDGDGRADFVVRRASSGAGVFWKRFANATFETEPFGLATDSVVPGDYDGDGKTDLSIVRTSGANYVWEFEPSGTVGSTIVSDTWGVPGDVIAQGDYDGDGKTDYAVWRPGSPATFFMMTVGTRFITSKLWGQTGDTPVAGYNTF